MSITIPSNASEVISRIKADMQANLPQSNPYLKNGMLNAYTIGTGRAIFDIYENLRIQQLQFFPQTATDKYLDYWGELRSIKRRTPTFSEGNAIAQGSLLGTSIPKGSKLSIGSSLFTVKTDSLIYMNNFSIESLSQVGGRATATFSSSQPLATGITVIVGGSNEPGYNGSFVIDVISETSFTYDVDPNTPHTATGPHVCAYNYSVLDVESDKAGSESNFPSGTKMTFQQSIQNVSPNAFVTLGGLEGGGDLQSDDDYRLSVISAWKLPIVYLNPAGIENIAKQVPGVTRVFVLRTTAGVSHGAYHIDSPGYFTVFILSDDNRTSIIPSGTVLDDVKKLILDVAPSGTGEKSVIVLAPTPINVNISISDIVPDSGTMRNAIQSSLDSFFRSGTLMNGVNDSRGTLTINKLNSVIAETVDDQSGEALRSYKLVSPNPCPSSGSADISVKDGEIVALGTVSFS